MKACFSNLMGCQNLPVTLTVCPPHNDALYKLWISQGGAAPRTQTNYQLKGLCREQKFIMAINCLH